MRKRTLKRSRQTQLPEFLRPLFWDYRFGSLSWEKDADLITERVLAVGEWDAVSWLRRQRTDAERASGSCADKGGD